MVGVWSSSLFVDKYNFSLFLRDDNFFSTVITVTQLYVIHERHMRATCTLAFHLLGAFCGEVSPDSNP